jgi:hypothetical protein
MDGTPKSREEDINSKNAQIFSNNSKFASNTVSKINSFVSDHQI